MLIKKNPFLFSISNLDFFQRDSESFLSSFCEHTLGIVFDYAVQVVEWAKGMSESNISKSKKLCDVPNKRKSKKWTRNRNTRKNEG